ncbi:sugar kinase [Alicyclobacillus sp. SO9]|uniref:sugar kinase n=1 Tax=Alicyclobacillus sp. SO9 TaxID=2665646 RepID=UPI0018E8A663|nr:sugar kinase [Alicyclobacillus sp. SO9]QQE77578.1 sugar kinase [Alicyclobacillus sp. SO9]
MDVITWGESMVLFTPQNNGPLESVAAFQKGVAGAESNVAIGLSRLGHQVTWISKLGEDSFGRYIFKTLRGEGVDVSKVQFSRDHRTGIMFKELLHSNRTNVLYYRQNSAASHLQTQDISLETLQETPFMLVTGITPALSADNRLTTAEVMKRARKLGIRVVFDPNIRLKLWPLDEARPVLLELAALSDIVLPGIDEGKLLVNETHPERIADAFLQLGANTTVVKLGPKGAYYKTQHTANYVTGFPVELVNEVGAGDAFAAGLVSGLLDELSMDEAVLRACALGALAVTVMGDYEGLPYRAELNDFMSGQSKPAR